MKNILFVGAHHDDLELGLGGSVKRWALEGKNVFSAILTNSEWQAPQGNRFRKAEDAIAQCTESARILGYKPYNLLLCNAMDLQFDDAHVVEVLKIIEQEEVDTLITIWEKDAHPAHRAAANIALAATRKMANVLTVRLSWNSTSEAFKPCYFVDISNTFESKIKALRCYRDEWERTGKLWEKYSRSSAMLYGLESRFELAEGFQVVKLCQN